MTTTHTAQAIVALAWSGASGFVHERLAGPFSSWLVVYDDGDWTTVDGFARDAFMRARLTPGNDASPLALARALVESRIIVEFRGGTTFEWTLLDRGDMVEASGCDEALSLALDALFASAPG